MVPSLSVIVPTIGRATLNRALFSCEGADQLIVIHDQTGDMGYTARRKGIQQATGTHLAFLDDDDEFAPGAIDLMRDAACDVPVIFRMDDPLHGILWRDPTLRFANVGTPMFVVPNDPKRLGHWVAWENGRGGDFTFITGCCRSMGGPVWREEITSIVRSSERETIHAC